MKKWDDLPEFMRCDEARPYYDILKRKWFYRFVKRTFDIFASFFLLIILFLPSLVIGIVICCDSKGGPFFLQERVGRYGKMFRIVKFRSMKKNSEGSQHITHKDDLRVTKVGKFIRKTHIDEFPQLLNVIVGQMSFVGTRPEVSQFVSSYQKEWYATLLMKPGITSSSSYTFENESNILLNENADYIYLNEILPKKMNFNLLDLKKSSIFIDLRIIFKTVFK